jgi:Xaa-Pro aminopeptidase
MQTMHPTLLVGPADWNAQRMPRQEFDARLAALWRHHPNASGAIVYGNSGDHAALAYLTHFTPKLEAALALIPRQGEAQLLIGGGINMVPAAKPLTFVANLGPLREAAKTAAGWARALAPGGSLLLIGGDAMPGDLRRAFDLALGADFAVEAADAALQAAMRVKRPCELRVLREACGILDAAVAALGSASRQGNSVTDCILFAEHAALARGAQDVRSLFSLDGGRTLRPFDVPIAERREPLAAYLAVRHDGYWAEAFVRTAPAGEALQGAAESVLRAILANVKAGLPCRQLQRIADAGRGALRLHPLADGVLGSAIGLSLDEPPLLRSDGNVTLEPGAVYSLRAGLLDDAGQGAIVSAMVALTPDGTEVLWPIGRPS